MFKKTSEEIKEEERALKSYQENKQRRLYKEPVAVIPYANYKSRKVTRYGFERIQDTLP